LFAYKHERQANMTEVFADILILYSNVTGTAAAQSLEGIKKLVGKLIDIKLLGCDDGPVSNPAEIDKQMSTIGTLVAVLSKDFLKQKSSVYVMECALKHKKRIVLVHDQATCFFPGEAEQPQSLKDAHVFHDKAITYMKEYTDFVVKQVLKKALRASLTHPTMAEIVLFHHESQQEIADKFLKPAFDKIKTKTVPFNEKSGETAVDFAKKIIKTLAMSRSVVIMLHECMVAQKAIHFLREPIHLALMLNSQCRVYVLYDEDNTPVMLNAFAREANSPDVRQFVRQGVVTLLDEKNPEVAAKSIIAQEKKLGGCRDETETHTRCFLSHKRSSAQGMCGRIYQGLKNHYKVFLDSEADFDLHDLTAIVKNTKLFVFILSAGILDSYWCLQELLSAYKENKRFLVIRDWQYQLPSELPETLPIKKEERASLRKILDDSPRIDYMAEFYEHCITAIREHLGPSDEIIAAITEALKSENLPLLKKLDQKHPGRDGVIEMGPLLSSKVSLLDYANALQKYWQVDLAKVHTLDFTGSFNITSAGLKAFGEYCPNIKTLVLRDCKDLADDALQNLVKHCKQLESVDLGNCRQLTHRGVSALFAASPNLQHINLENCSAVKISAFKGLEKKCPKLEHVVLSGVYEIDKYALEFLGVSENIKKLNVSNCSVDDEGISHLKLKKLQELHLAKCTAVTDKGLKHVADSAPDLEVINLSNCSKITDEGLQQLALKCHKIHTIILSYCNNITAKGIQNLATSCPDIKTIDLKNCLNIDDAAIINLTNGCKKLEKISLEGCFLVKDASLKALEVCKNLKDLDLTRTRLTPVMLKELAKLTSLERLRVKECSIEEENNELSLVASGLKNLKVIDLKQCSDIKDEHVKALTANNKNIRTLILAGCSQLMAEDYYEAAALQSITNGCPDLEELDLSGCWHINDIALKKFWNKETKSPRLKNIKKLSLRDCTEITNDGLKNISRGCPTLEHLDLSGITTIDESGMIFIGRKCRNLQGLLLEHCTNIASGVCQILAEHCPKLSVLNLRGCQGIDDSGLNYLSEGCNNIQDLNLYDCDSITDTGIKHLARGCPNLQSLDLSECDNVSDVAIRYLANNCFQIRTLSLSGSMITDAALKTLLQVCPNMENFTLTGCPNVTNDILKYIVEACSNIQSITVTGSEDISDLGLVNLVKCKRLISLNISGAAITDSGLAKFCEKYPNIQKLDISNCIKIKDRGVSFLTRCRYLAVLNLSECVEIGNVGIAKISTLPNLSELNLDGLTKVNDESVQSLAKCKRLKVLDLSYTSVTDKACEFIKQLALRKEIYLRGVSLTAEGLEKLVEGDANLRGLAISGQAIDDQAIEKYIKGSQTLDYLDIIDTSITDLACDALKDIRNLKQLTLQNNAQLTDAGIQKLAQTKANLMALDISQNAKLTSAALEELPASLHDLNVQGCDIDDDGLEHVSYRCRNLQSLNISNCDKITDKGLAKIASSCSNLFELQAEGCTQITDDGADYFGPGVLKTGNSEDDEEEEDYDETTYTETAIDDDNNEEDSEDEEDEEEEDDEDENEQDEDDYLANQESEESEEEQGYNYDDDANDDDEENEDEDEDDDDEDENNNNKKKSEQAESEDDDEEQQADHQEQDQEEEHEEEQPEETHTEEQKSEDDAEEDESEEEEQQHEEDEDEDEEEEEEEEDDE